jgi:hypothetical protein
LALTLASVVLWPLPVLTLFKVGRATVARRRAGGVQCGKKCPLWPKADVIYFGNGFPVYSNAHSSSVIGSSVIA